MPKPKPKSKAKLSINKLFPFSRLQALLLILILATVGVVVVYRSTAVSITTWRAAAKQYGCPLTNDYPPTLRRGSSGNCVRFLQNNLNYAYGRAVLSVDGQFGPATESSVSKLKASAHLPADGIAGPALWSYIKQCESDNPALPVWVCTRIK